MAAAVLNSPRAVQVSVYVVRAFVRLAFPDDASGAVAAAHRVRHTGAAAAARRLVTGPHGWRQRGGGPFPYHPMAMPARPDTDSRWPKILVIDDDPAVGSALKVRLGDVFRVVVITDPRQAVEVARAERPDVILCDIDMPGMQGDEVAWALSEERATQFIPLIYLSSLVRPRDSGSDLDGPFGGHPAVSKSAPAKELREIIGGMLGPRY